MNVYGQVYVCWCPCNRLCVDSYMCEIRKLERFRQEDCYGYILFKNKGLEFLSYMSYVECSYVENRAYFICILEIHLHFIMIRMLT